MKNLKVAVIGAGHLGSIHARLLAGIPGVALVGIADPRASARDKVAADCGAASFADHRELLGRCDAAIVATPTRHHHAVAMDFLRHKTPLLIEKPLAADLAEADQLVRAARQHGVLLQVGHVERFNPAFAAAAQRVRHPRYVEAVRASTFTGRSTDIGVVYDLMIHDIDLVLSLVESAVVRVQAIGLALLGPHEDVAQARLEFADGCVANLSASRASFASAPRRQMHIWSEQGFAAIDFGMRQTHCVTPCDAVVERTFDYQALSSEEKASFQERLFTEILRVDAPEVESRNALLDELYDFVAAVREHREPRVTGTHGRDAVAVAESILAAIGKHRWEGRADGPVGPLAAPQPTILRGPHWPKPGTDRREAG